MSAGKGNSRADSYQGRSRRGSEEAGACDPDHNSDLHRDHVREVLFGMRFVLDTALTRPGTDLGEAPEPRFDPEPRPIEVEETLSGIDREAGALRDRLAALGQTE